MFDILTDSALDIANGLLDQAWGGKFPQGGLDFPSACVLSKSGPEHSDLHLELGIVEATDSVSEVPWLADLTHGEVQGPHDSDSPFKFINGEGDIPGMFGTALKAYGQVIAILDEYGVPWESYDKWFRSQWGIDPNLDLSIAVPILRSHGAAMWGGLARKLAPSSYCNIATSKQVRVRWHGKSRKDFGEDALVDWPRLTAIAQTIGSYLLVEDKTAKTKRIDFRIVKAEIPKAPKRPGDVLCTFPYPEKWEIRDTVLGALEFLNGFRKASLHLARNALGTTGTLKLGQNVQIPGETLAEFIKEHRLPPAPVDIGEADDSGVFDFLDEPRDRTKVHEDGPNLTIYTAFASAIRPYIVKNWDKMPRGFEIYGYQEAILDVDSDAKHATEGKVRDLISLAVPDDFLLRVYRVMCVAKKARDPANATVVALLRALRAPRSVFQTHDYVSVGASIKANPACWTWLLAEIGKQISANVYSKGINYSFTSNLWRILSSNANGDIALAEILRQRKNWWANEYIRRAKLRPEKRVLYQVKARLFRATQIVIEEQGTVYVNKEHEALIGALVQSVRAFLRKRRAFKFNVEHIIDPGRNSLLEYARHLDRTYHPTVKWEEGVLDYYRSIEYMADDVREIMTYIAAGCNVAHQAPVGGIEDFEIGDPESEENLESDVESTDGGHLVEEIEPVEDDDMEFGLDSDDEEDDSHAGQIDLKGELQDEYGHIPIDLRMAVVSKFGQHIHNSVLPSVIEELQASYYAYLRKNVEDQELGGDDILDKVL